MNNGFVLSALPDLTFINYLQKTHDSSRPDGVGLFHFWIMRNPIGRPDQTGAHRAQFDANKKYILATQSICAICGTPVDKSLKSPHPMSATIDHIIPVSKGGNPSAIDNLQLTHRCCNRAKSDKLATPKDAKKDTDPNRVLPLSHDWRTF